MRGCAQRPHTHRQNYTLANLVHLIHRTHAHKKKNNNNPTTQSQIESWRLQGNTGLKPTRAHTDTHTHLEKKTQNSRKNRINHWQDVGGNKFSSRTLFFPSFVFFVSFPETLKATQSWQQVRANDTISLLSAMTKRGG